MNWDALGAIGELLGAIVVVVSVVYLASQVRQNTAASRAEALRSFSIEVSRQFEDMGCDERMSAIWHRLLYEGVGREDLEPAERISAGYSLMSRLNLYDAAFRSYQEGILAEEEFASMLTTRILDIRFTLESWNIFRQELSPDFVDYMEKAKPDLALGNNS